MSPWCHPSLVTPRCHLTDKLAEIQSSLLSPFTCFSDCPICNPFELCPHFYFPTEFSRTPANKCIFHISILDLTTFCLLSICMMCLVTFLLSDYPRVFSSSPPRASGQYRFFPKSNSCPIFKSVHFDSLTHVSTSLPRRFPSFFHRDPPAHPQARAL